MLFRVRLGAVGVGTVYEAVQVQLQRTVAIKVLRGGAAQPRRDQILEEARKAASIQDPGIVALGSYAYWMASPRSRGAGPDSPKGPLRGPG